MSLTHLRKQFLVTLNDLTYIQKTYCEKLPVILGYLLKSLL